MNTPLLDGISKQAIVGPVLDIATAGIPSILAGVSATKKIPESKEEAQATLDKGYKGSLLKMMLIPGFWGHFHGKRTAATNFLNMNKVLKNAYDQGRETGVNENSTS